jgi:hypothetical protein
MRSRAVKPLTAGLVTATLRPDCSARRLATIWGQPWASLDAPVPAVYESPRAR